MYIDIDITEKKKIEIGQPFGSLESGKGAAILVAPISRTILDINIDVEMNPKLININCYGKGWIIKVRPSDLKNELPKLFSPTSPAFITWQKDGIEKLRKKKERSRS